MSPSAAQTVSSGLNKLQQTINGSVEGQKIADLAKDTRDYHDPANRITTDYGVKQNNTGELHSHRYLRHSISY